MEKILAEMAQSEVLQDRVRHLAFTLKAESKHFTDEELLLALQFIVDKIKNELH